MTSSQQGEEFRPNFANTSEESDDRDYILDDCHKIASPVNRQLRHYQRQGIKFLYRRCFSSGDGGGGAILADDMGLGKTIQVIGLLSALLKKTHRAEEDRAACRSVRYSSEGTAGMFLIVCPASVLRNWEKEFETWGFFVLGKYYKNERTETLQLCRLGRLEVVLTTFETARESVDNLNGVEWDGVIIDEVHKIKDPKSKITEAMKSIRCRRRIGLTGTLLQNSYDELWCVLDWANPNCLGSKESFTQRYTMPIERGLRIDALKGELAMSRKRLKMLDEKKCEWVLRRTKDKTISDQLPKKIDQVVYCQPSKLQMSLYRAFHASDDMKFVLSANNPCSCGSQKTSCRCCHQTSGGDPEKTFQSLQFQFIHLFLKASNHVALLLPSNTSSERQAEAGAGYCKEAFKSEDGVRLLKDGARCSFETLSNAKYSGKMEVLVELLNALQEEEEPAKVLLFSYSTMVLNILEVFVQSKGYNYLRLDGKTRTEVRQDIVDEFNTDPDVFLFLISTKAGGVGLNITGANVVIVFDPNWNPAHDLQAQDRAYRIGQKRDVRVFRLITAGSIEENVYLRQIYKQQMSKSAVDGETATRYFNAVLKHKKGELFGLKNMFAIRENGQRLLTDEILKRNSKVEEVVRGRKKMFEVEENLLNYSNGSDDEEGASASRTSDDPFGLNLDQELIDHEVKSPEKSDKLLSEWVKKKQSVGDVLKSDKVVHSHVNQNVVGGNKVEEHISKVAMEQVASGDKGGGIMADAAGIMAGLEPVLFNCDMIDSQNLADEAEYDRCLSSDEDERMAVGGEAVLAARRKPAVLRADSERMFRVSDGLWLRYGQTPVALQRRDFKQLAEFLGRTVEGTAKHVLELEPREKADLLQRFYVSLGYDGAEKAYEVIKTQIDEEEVELEEAKARLERDGEEDGESAKKNKTKRSSKHKEKVITNDFDIFPSDPEEEAGLLMAAEKSVEQQSTYSSPSSSPELSISYQSASPSTRKVLKPTPEESYSRIRPKNQKHVPMAKACSQAYYSSILNFTKVKEIDEMKNDIENRFSDSDSCDDHDEKVARKRMRPTSEETHQKGKRTKTDIRPPSFPGPSMFSKSSSSSPHIRYKPSPEESYSRHLPKKQKSVPHDRVPSHLCYDDILNPKRPQESQLERRDDDNCDDAVEKEEIVRRKIKPAPEETYQSRSAAASIPIRRKSSSDTNCDENYTSLLSRI
jgi:superfamily II DNA or RNA helicase